MGCAPGPEGGDGGPAAGGFRSTPGEAASAGGLVGVCLDSGVGLPRSNALPVAPGAGDTFPAGDVPGLAGGIPLAGGVARGVATGEVTPRGVAAGDTAAAGLLGAAGGV